MRLAIASEHAGFHLKETIVQYIREKGIEIDDFGSQSDEPVDYPFIAAGLAEKVVQGEYELGILICGTGIGMSIASGKVPGVRAALCTDPFMAQMAREHNDANILCLGAWITGLKLSYAIIDAFLDSGFTGDRHVRRVSQIKEIEQRYSIERSPEKKA